MKILVTGGLGFIGHNVVKQLQDAHEITVVDSCTTYGIIPKVELDTLIKERKQGLDCHKVIGDIRDSKQIWSTMFTAKPDVVIHLASFPRAKVVNSDPVTGSEVMTTSLLNLLSHCKTEKVKRFVYVSSSMVYGDFPNNTTEFGRILQPQGIYAILKYSGELLVKDFCKANGIEYVIVRPSAVYGPKDVEDRVVSKFIMNAIRGDDIVVKGAQETLDFTYVSDIASGICAASLLPRAVDQTYNMTRGVGHTLLEAAELIIGITNSSSKLVVNEKDKSFPSRGSLSIDKARNELGFNPTINIEQGFKLYYDWITHHPVFRPRAAV